jgi:hypothetical protein
VITHLAVLAAAHPGHVSNLKYATETWTPGGTFLALIIIGVLVVAWLKLVPSGPKVTARRRKPRPAAKAWERARMPARRSES